MGRWICGCGWKSEPIGTKSSKRFKAKTDEQFKPDEEAESSGRDTKDNRQPIVTYCVACEYESQTDFDICPRCQSEGRAVLVVRKA
jgi:uncharacterized paraquat-inducible protein A